MSHRKIHHFIELIVRWTCPREDHDELLGDIQENFNWRSKNTSAFIAHLKLWFDVINLIRIHSLKRLLNMITPGLLRNFLKVYIRSVKLKPGEYAVTFGGLTLGILSVLLIMVFVIQEHSYDNYHPEAEDIYRIVKTERDNRFGGSSNGTSYLFRQYLLNDVSAVSDVVQIINGRWDRKNFRYPESKPWGELSLHYANTSFFKVFGIKLLIGNSDHVFESPNNVVVSQSLSQKIFDGDAMGKTVHLDNQRYVVTGIMEDIPLNTHFQADYLLPVSSLFQSDFWDKERLKTDWSYADFIFNYVKVRPDSDLMTLEDQLAKYSELSGNESYGLMPVKDIHLKSLTDWELSQNGKPQFVNIVMVVGIIILILTTINFINITIARGAVKGKEVAIRKVQGASGLMVASQLFFENFLTLILCLLIAYFSAFYVLKFVDMSGITVESDLLMTMDVILRTIVVILAITFLSSIYVVLLQLKYKAVDAIRGKILGTGRSFGLLQGLVMIQIMVSFFLITSSFFFQDQIELLFRKDLGFQKDQLLYMERNQYDEQTSRHPVFMDELMKHSGIHNVTNSGQLPLRWPAGVNYELVPEGEESGITMSRGFIGYRYFETLGVPVVQGREFQKDFAQDTAGLILNESAVKAFGWKDPIGKRVKVSFRGGRVIKTQRVIGVVKDFNYRSLHDALQPSYFMLSPNANVITVNFDTKNTSDVIEYITDTWKEHSPNEALDIRFLEQQFEASHSQDVELKDLLKILSLVVVGLACLGLFGMSQYTSSRRTREISVRKIFGAGISQIFWLLERKYFVYGAIAMILSIVPTIWLVHAWMDHYAYQAELNLLRFAQSYIMLMFIMLVISGYHTWRVTVMDPVRMLRDE